MDRPQEADVPADVYGLGMTVVFALHGADLPYEVVRDAAGFAQTLDASPAIEQALQRAIHWDWKERYPTVSAFSRALRLAMPDLDLKASLHQEPCLALERTRFPTSQPEGINACLAAAHPSGLRSVPGSPSPGWRHRPPPNPQPHHQPATGPSRGRGAPPLSPPAKTIEADASRSNRIPGSASEDAC